MYNSPEERILHALGKDFNEPVMLKKSETEYGLQIDRIVGKLLVRAAKLDAKAKSSSTGSNHSVRVFKKAESDRDSGRVAVENKKNNILVDKVTDPYRQGGSVDETILIDSKDKQTNETDQTIIVELKNKVVDRENDMEYVDYEVSGYPKPKDLQESIGHATKALSTVRSEIAVAEQHEHDAQQK